MPTRFWTLRIGRIDTVLNIAPGNNSCFIRILASWYDILPCSKLKSFHLSIFPQTPSGKGEYFRRKSFQYIFSDFNAQDRVKSPDIKKSHISTQFWIVAHGKLCSIYKWSGGFWDPQEDSVPSRKTCQIKPSSKTRKFFSPFHAIFTFLIHSPWSLISSQE